MKSAHLNTIFVLLSILFVSMIVSSTMGSRESMELGDWSCHGTPARRDVREEYPGIHYSNTNDAVLIDEDLPMKPSIYNKLSWGWSGLDNKQ